MLQLADLAKNSNDKLVEGFTSELITDSYLLSALPFDNCLTPNGVSDLVYAYKRVKTPATAAFRELGKAVTESEPTIERITTKAAILSSGFSIDRVAMQAAADLVTLYLKEAEAAIVRKFNDTLINGDTTSDQHGFDGLAKALKGKSTEKTSKVDWKTGTDLAKALAFAEELDDLFGALMRTPDVLLVSPQGFARINATARQLGLGTTSPDTAGNQVATWNGVRIEVLRDGAIKDGAVYAACLGLDGFHGITLTGNNAITVNVPTLEQAGAIKKGDAEFVCGCALKATTAAAVLKPKA